MLRLDTVLREEDVVESPLLPDFRVRLRELFFRGEVLFGSARS
jgi:hypothetical protein